MDISIQVDMRELEAAAERMTGPGLMQAIGVSMTRAAAKAKLAGIKEFAQHGIGRKIFGRNDSGARKLVAISDLSLSGDRIVLTMTAKGFVAMQEQGGRTKPHLIKAKRGKALAFAGTGGLTFAPYVSHPGATMPAHPALVPETDKIPADVIADARAAIAALWAGRAA